MLLEKYAALKVDLNAKVEKEMTIFHCACFYGQSKLVNILLQNSGNLKIDLNAKDGLFKHTALNWACWAGKTELVKMMIENPNSSKFDLKIKDLYGRTAFQNAEERGNQDIVALFKRKLPAGSY